MIPLNCELLDLRALVAIADGKSFLRAAEQLHLSQPALSRRIQKLEAAVGAPLLERTTRNVRLTPAGQEVVPLMRRLLEEMDGSLLATMALGERKAGRVTLASIPSATLRFLPAALEHFAQDYRNYRVRVLDLSATECATAVRTGGKRNSPSRFRSRWTWIWRSSRSPRIPTGSYAGMTTRSPHSTSWSGRISPCAGW